MKRGNWIGLIVTVMVGIFYLGMTVPEVKTYPPFLKKAQSLGFPAKDCTYCHVNAKGGEPLNPRGEWLHKEEHRRKADAIDVAWLKEYKEDGSAASNTGNTDNSSEAQSAKPETKSPTASHANAGSAEVSDRGTAEVTVKKTKLSIEYGRPTLNGRDMLSKANVGMIWRIGKNQATRLETTGDLTVAGKELKAGKYTLGAKKTGENSWTLLFYPRTDLQGGQLPQEGYTAELPLKFEKASDSVEALTITLTDQKTEAALKIQWGTAVLSGSIGVK
jgi:hypothetical protein